MRVRLKSDGLYIIVVVLLASQLLSSNVNFILLSFLLVYYLLINRLHIRMDFPGGAVYLILLVWGLVIGVVYAAPAYAYLKHVYYFSLPFLYWTVAQQIKRKENNRHNEIMKMLLVSSVIYSVYDILNALFSLGTASFTSINELRNIIGTSNFLAVIGLYILVFYKEKIDISKRIRRLLMIILVISSIMHFSRIIILAMIILICFSGVRINFKKIAKFFAFATVIIVLIMFFAPELTNLFITKISDSSNELDFLRSSWSHPEIVQNWRGYEMHCELVRFEKANILERLFGSGFGSGLDVFGYSYLVTKEATLSVLHNGYFTVLMIWGGVGVATYLLWIYRMYKYSIKLDNMQDRNFFKGLVVMILITTLFVKGPLFSSSMAVSLFYLSLLTGDRD